MTRVQKKLHSKTTFKTLKTSKHLLICSANIWFAIFPEIIKITVTFTNTFQVAEQSDQLFFTCTHEEADTRVDKFGWSVERESGAVTLVWFKGIFFQSLRFNHLTLFLISHILKQTRSFFFQVCLRMYNFLLPTHFNELSFFSTDLLQP